MSKRFGVMLDNSRNAVMKPSQVKKFVDYLAAMGYNALMLYTEDTYEIDGEPKFGYLRGRYTKDELKEIDAYCAAKGVELIPCIQTLAHLNSIFRWSEYACVNDTRDILLADDERTYQLIDRMFDTLSECFTSRLVNIGMDEAHDLGRGKYLDKHGLVDRFEILTKHLRRVLEIAKNHGFECAMWSDMFMRLANGGDYYGSNVSGESSAQVPNGVNLIYWDYYHDQKETYDKMFALHEKLVSRDRIWFAGGAWSWNGFVPDNAYTRRTMTPAMLSCREKGIENIIITMWGDNGKECSSFALLPSLYYIKRTYEGESDLLNIKRGFNALTGLDYDSMCLLDSPNDQIYPSGECTNESKYFLYNDLFLGKFDAHVPEGIGAKFAKCGNVLRRRSTSCPGFKYLFDTESALCDVLAIKAELGVKIRAAYKAGDKDLIKKLALEVRRLEVKLDRFFVAFKDLWHRENKPHGFDVQDARLGGLKQRLRSCRERLDGYVAGKIDSIPELEEEILPFWHDDAPHSYNWYENNAIANIL